MEARIIKTDEQYRHFRSEVARLAVLDPEPESPQGVRLELLAKLVEDYERVRFAFAKPDPVDAILFRMEQQGLRQKDIAPLLGGKNRASEVLARKRSLTLPMIRALYEKLDIPLGLLVREPEAGYSAASSVGWRPGRAGRSRSLIRQEPELSGFEGFIPLGQVPSSLLDVPAEVGVYVVARLSKLPAVFRKQSQAGWFKDQDPSYPIDVLKAKWVRNAETLYIGRAGPTARRTLRRRISELVRFGSGESVAHRGGRALWQLEGIWDAIIAWKVSRNDPAKTERKLIAQFERKYGQLPFANFRR